MPMTDIHDQDVHGRVRDYYRQATDPTRRLRQPVCDDDRWGSARYAPADLDASLATAATSSMGCGNPCALADLHEGEVVLDLGSGAGLDVILSARRVGPGGHAYGVDFLEEMRDLARQNAAQAGVRNVTFLNGTIEDLPLPDGSVDVVISNCVINLTPDKAPVFAEMARVLRPGGRVAISDVVADDNAPPANPGDDSWAECGAGGLRRSKYQQMLQRAGFQDVTIEFTHEVSPALHAAAVRGVRSRSMPA